MVTLEEGEEYVVLLHGFEGYEVMFLDKDGEPKMTSIPIRDENGEETGESAAAPRIVEPTIADNRLNEIPFTFFNVTDNKLSVQKPPSLPIVNTSLSYYRDSADYQESLHLSSAPTPYITGKGINVDALMEGIGSGKLWVLPEGAKLDYLEFSGQGLEAQRNALKDKENLLRAQGATLFTTDDQLSSETATSARIRQQSQTSILINIIKTVEAGLNRVLRQTARWMALNENEVNVVLPKDIVDPKLSPEEVKELVALYEANAITHETLFNSLTQGEFIASNRTAEEEEALLQDENTLIQ